MIKKNPKVSQVREYKKYKKYKENKEQSMELEQIVDVAIEVGYGLLYNGAEIYRVEQSITYICRAYGIEEIEAFAIPSSIVVTISDGKRFVTKSKRVIKRGTDLDKVEKMAGLSRKICKEKLDYEACKREIEKIKTGPVYSKKVCFIAYVVIGFVFTRLFGGTVIDGCLGSIVGICIVYLQKLMNRMKANSFFINIVCGFFSAFTANILELKTGLFHADNVIIGTIMLLVPGLTIANSMRDFISSDTMTGMSRLFEALFVAVGIAIGVTAAMAIV